MPQRIRRLPSWAISSIMLGVYQVPSSCQVTKIVISAPKFTQAPFGYLGLATLISLAI